MQLTSREEPALARARSASDSPTAPADSTPARRKSRRVSPSQNFASPSPLNCSMARPLLLARRGRDDCDHGSTRPPRINGKASCERADRTPPPAPSPKRRGGERHLLLPLSASGRGRGGGVCLPVVRNAKGAWAPL